MSHCTAIKAKPGDWVPGHEAVYFAHRFAIKGRITHVSPSGKTVRFAPETAARVLTGFRRDEIEFAYRPRLGRWLERGSRPTADVDGLCRLRCGGSQS